MNILACADVVSFFSINVTEPVSATANDLPAGSNGVEAEPRKNRLSTPEEDAFEVITEPTKKPSLEQNPITDSSASSPKVFISNDYLNNVLRGSI